MAGSAAGSGFSLAEGDTGVGGSGVPWGHLSGGRTGADSGNSRGDPPLPAPRPAPCGTHMSAGGLGLRNALERIEETSNEEPI